MGYCNLLKQFYEEQQKLVDIVESLVLDTNDKTPYRYYNTGGSHDGTDYRLKINDYYVQIEISNDLFSLSYSTDRSSSLYDKCKFFEDNTLGSVVNFGHYNTNFISVEDSNRRKEIQYPIIEERYFQYLTLFDLCELETYNFFVNMEKHNKCIISLTLDHDTGLDSFISILNDRGQMKLISDAISLLNLTYRSIIGL